MHRPPLLVPVDQVDQVRVLLRLADERRLEQLLGRRPLRNATDARRQKKNA